MTKEEFSKIAAALRTYYPSQNIMPNRQSMELWYMQLCDIDYQIMTMALNQWVAVNKWSPTIADLREAAYNITSPGIPDWDSAYEDVRKNIRKYGFYNAEEGLAHLDGVTLETVKRLGYTKMCLSDNPTALRANFRDVYNRLAERSRAEAKMPVGLLNAVRTARLQMQEGNNED
jgi:hypothetical protein